MARKAKTGSGTDPKPKSKRATERKPRPPRVNKGSATNETDANHLKLMDKILDLTETGASIREISHILQAQGEKNCSRSTVHALLKEALAIGRKQLGLKAAEIIDIELGKLHRVEVAHFPSLLKTTSSEEAERLSQVMDRVWKRRDSLLGLNKPIKVQIDPQKGLAELLGVAPEAIPSGNAES